MRKLLFTFCILTAHLAVAWQRQDTLRIETGDPGTAFTRKIQVKDTRTQKNIVLKDGRYRLAGGDQEADLLVKGGRIEGTLVTTRGQERSEFVIGDSWVSRYNQYRDTYLLATAWRVGQKAFFEAYYRDKSLDTEGWMSLDQHKHYGRGVTKQYYENGKLKAIHDEVTATHTTYYANGNKKEVSGPRVFETYHEDGSLDNRQYTENNVRYNCYYKEGKRYSRSWQDKAGNEITEYYQDGGIQRKEIVKQVSGELRRLTYNKAGKLVSDEPAGAAAVGQ